MSIKLSLQITLVMIEFLSHFLCIFRFFSPLGMAPVVGLVGLGLFQRGFPAVSLTLRNNKNTVSILF